MNASKIAIPLLISSCLALAAFICPAASPEDSRITVKLRAVNADLDGLLGELDVIRRDPAFHEKGFDIAAAEIWKQRVNAIQARINSDEDMPSGIRRVPEIMLLLADAWRHSGGEDTEETKQLIFSYLKAIEWKLVK